VKKLINLGHNYVECKKQEREAKKKAEELLEKIEAMLIKEGMEEFAGGGLRISRKTETKFKIADKEKAVKYFKEHAPHMLTLNAAQFNTYWREEIEEKKKIPGFVNEVKEAKVSCK